MQKATLIVNNTTYFKNRFFSEDPMIIRDNQHASFIKLKYELLKIGIDLSTEDINPPSASKIIIYLNVEKKIKFDKSKKIIYGLMQEPPGINDQNWEQENYAKYTRLFTWNDDFVDNLKVFKLPFGYSFEAPKIDRSWNQRALCTSIIGFKNFDHQPDMYEQRIKISKWFTKKHPDEYVFYGQGWSNVLNISNLCANITKNPYKLIKILKKYYPLKKVYGGEVFSKQKILSQYKFSICFENTVNVPGFLTEKIFDCFSSGTIPIYWGASNINKLIPETCYIDYRKYDSYDDLYIFLKQYNQDKYIQYVNNVKSFIKGKKSKPFKDRTYALTLKKYILLDLKMLNNKETKNVV